MTLNASSPVFISKTMLVWIDAVDEKDARNTVRVLKGGFMTYDIEVKIITEERKERAAVVKPMASTALKEGK